MKITTILATLLVWLAALPLLGASIGDPAPPLHLEHLVKGPHTRIAPGTNIYVVDFWATWCGPCKRSIPHITEMQKKYASQGVVFLGISDEAVTKVAPFVASQGNSMAYRVATDTSKATFRSWMTAYGENGIPHAFVVGTNGVVLWHGFPDESLDRALDRIIGGKFDLEHEKNFETGDRLVQQYTAFVKRSNVTAQGATLGSKILDEYSRDWRIPHRLAKAILTDAAVRSRDLDLALRASKKAVELTKQRSYDALSIHARALFANGKKQEAIEAQKQALALCNDPAERPELEKLLAMFEKGAPQGAKVN